MSDIDNKTLVQNFERFFLLTFPKVKAFALKILKSEEDAEDIAQDIFVKLWSYPEIWRDKNNIDGYIYTMVRNHIFNFIKQKEVRRTYQDSLSAPEPFHNDFDIHDHLYAKELALLAKLAINRMPERRREVYLLSRVQGKSNSEIASMLRLSVRTVERHLYLALSELRKIVFFLIFIL
jgi:RNA polymerase sigma-70 factor (ECF subfamily)